MVLDVIWNKLDATLVFYVDEMMFLMHKKSRLPLALSSLEHLYSFTAHQAPTKREKARAKTRRGRIEEVLEKNMDAHVSQIIQNNLAVQNAVHQVAADSIEARPLNTRRAYDVKQQEWIGWCAERSFNDGSIVTEGKIILYLQTVVIPRGNGRVENGVVQPLSVEVLECYVKPLVDLYSTHQSLGGAPMPHPRGEALKELLRTHKRKRAANKRVEYQDRGEGTVQDAYSMEELKRIALYSSAREQEKACGTGWIFCLGTS